MAEPSSFDIVIVGAGNAALTAAVSAYENGATVAVRRPVPQAGVCQTERLPGGRRSRTIARERLRPPQKVTGSRPLHFRAATSFPHRGVAQLAARSVRDAEAVSSSLTTPTAAPARSLLARPPSGGLVGIEPTTRALGRPCSIR